MRVAISSQTTDMLRPISPKERARARPHTAGCVAHGGWRERDAFRDDAIKRTRDDEGMLKSKKPTGTRQCCPSLSTTSGPPLQAQPIAPGLPRPDHRPHALLLALLRPHRARTQHPQHATTHNFSSTCHDPSRQAALNRRSTPSSCQSPCTTRRHPTVRTRSCSSRSCRRPAARDQLDLHCSRLRRPC